MADRTTRTTKAAARKATTTTKRTTGRKATAARTSNGPSPAKPSPAAEAVRNKTGQPRLGKGGLEALVLDHLKQHPKVEFTSTELSHKLNRSNGAIQNALEKFARQGTAVLTSDAPRRYRYTGAKAARRASGTKKAR